MQLHEMNTILANLPEDSMNDYVPPALYIDIDTGAYGDAKRLVLINVANWSEKDFDEWHDMTDTMRAGYGLDVLYANEQTATPTQYAEEYGNK